MAHQNDKLKTQDIAQLVTMVPNQSNNPEMQALIGLLTQKLSREISKENEDLELREKARRANAEYLIQVAEAEKAAQAACTHQKPRGFGTALAGQKTHKDYHVFICQYCGKEFSNPPQSPDQKVPSHLYPDMNIVGGPH